jgi:hypothetical protein
MAATQGRSACSVLFIAVLLWGATVTSAQVTTGTILGTVTDPSDAAIAGAAVTVTDEGTGISHSFTTDEQGRYSIPELPVGTYDVQVQMQGFSTQVQKAANLAVGQQLLLNFKLSVGAITQEVTVSTQVAQVDVSTSTISTNVGEQQMQDLPLNGRNYTQLFSLAPGVSVTQPSAQPGEDRGLAPAYSVAGMRTNMASILLDGFRISGFWGTSAGLIIMGTSLGVESIGQFEVLTNGFSAEYQGASVINQVTRGGTNNLHGSAYGFFRNSAMDARNYFDPLSGPPPFHRYQFGGALGGPIKKDKSFFFVNYEGFRAQESLLDHQDLPDQNAHNGLLPCAVVSSVAFPACKGAAPSTLVNVGVNAAVGPFLALYPLRVGAVEVPNEGTESYTLPGEEPQRENYIAAKVDQQFSAKNSVAVRYVFDSGFQTNPWSNGANPAFPGIDAIVPNFESNPERNQYVTVQDKHIFSPGLLNVLSISFVRTNQGVRDNLSQAPPIMTFIPNYPMGAINISGAASIAPSAYLPLRFLQNHFAESDEVDWVHGAHNLKFGFGAERLQCNCALVTSPGGTYSFQASAPLNIGSGLQAFLQDKPISLSAPIPGDNNAYRNLRQLTLSVFIQDDWRVTKRLTVNMGLRDDFVTNPTDPSGRLWRIVNPLTDVFYTHETHYFQNNPSTKNIDPRVGFAWDVFGDQKTSVRSGFGVFHSPLLPRDYGAGDFFAYPLLLATQSLPTFPNALAGGFGQSSTTPPSARAAAAFNACCTPYALEYNFALERQIPGRVLVSATYLGSAGVHLFDSENYNTRTPTIEPDGSQFRTSTGPFPNPNFSYVEQYLPAGNSHYNSIEISAVRNIGKSLTFQSAFTWSKCIDTQSSDNSAGVSNDTSAVNIIPALPKLYDQGLCSYNVARNWTTNALIPLPFHGNQLKEGWEFSAITSLRSGSPFTPLIGFDQANLGASNYVYFSQRPNLNPVFTGPLVLGSPKEWFNPNAYTLQPTGFIGNAPRNIIPGPGSVGFDASLLKTTEIRKFGENSSLQIRVDMFNVINHANFAEPNPTVFTSASGIVSQTAGVISSTLSSARQLQFSAKLVF